MSDFILIKVQANLEGNECYECGSTGFVNLSHHEVTIGELLNEMNATDLMRYGLIRVKIGKDKPLDHESVNILKSYGWANAAAAKNAAEKKELEQKFYIVDTDRGLIHSFTIDDINDNKIDGLANGKKIVQVVSTKSVLLEKDYKRVKAKKAELEEIAKKKKEQREEKEKKRKLAAIEKAKKILKEANL